MTCEMTSLKQIVARLSAQPQAPVDQRLAWCRQALALILPGEHSELWAWLHVEVALCLAPQASDLPPETIREALAHYEQALQVYTPQMHLRQWVDARFNVARLHEHLPGIDSLEQAIQGHEAVVAERCERLPAAVWAESYTALARLYLQRTGGDHNKDIAQGIACAECALDLWDRTEQPVAWAEASDLLGLLYRRRWSDDPALDMEQSLACHQAALETLRPSQETHPASWGCILHNLGAAWLERLDGRRQENLARAIGCLDDALAVRTRRADLKAWAETQYTLALALIERTAADPAANAGRARQLLQELDSFYDPKTMPYEWALCRRALGDVYMRAMEGERAENIERAIGYYQEARCAGLPAHEQAATEHNLAIAYSERLLGPRLDNLSRAVEHGLRALVAVDPRDRLWWALIEVDLVDLLWKLALADPAQAEGRLEQAIAYGEQVVAAFAGRPMFHRLALAHYNLGNAYGDRRYGVRAENQQWAIAHYQRALEFYTRDNYPARWAETHNNLGVTWHERVDGDPAQNRRIAVEHYQHALQVLGPGTLPASARRAGRNLGYLYLQKGAWAQAADAFQTAVEAAEMLYQSSLLRQSREAELGQNADLYRCAAYALARARQPELAMVTLERGRARLLGDALGSDAGELEKLRLARPDLYRAYGEIVRRLTGRPAQEVELDRAALLSKADAMHADRQRLAGLAEQIRQETGIDLALTWTLDSLTRPLDLQMPLVYLLTTPAGGLALIWYGGQVKALPLEIADQEVQTCVQAWLTAYARRGKTWLDQIEATLSWLWKGLVGAPVKWLKRQGCSRAAWVPTGLLGLLPLHAARRREQGGWRYAVDDLTFAYAPSARSLAHAQQRAETVPADDLFAVDNPDGTLHFSQAEVDAAAGHFASDKTWVARRDRATCSTVESALSQCSVVHLSCHGRSYLDDPLHSALGLYGRSWTVADLLALQAQPRLRLAFLSACETGMPGTTLPDEAVGWGTGFIQAGAAAVVSTLWSVDEESTARLVARFYENWKGGSDTPADALAEAQRWLRNEAGDGRWSHPYYWAGFTLTGV